MDEAALIFEKEGNETELCVTKHPYQTTIVINPNEIDENGVPSFTVGVPVLK